MSTSFPFYRFVVPALVVGGLAGVAGIATGAISGSSSAPPRVAEGTPNGEPAVYRSGTEVGPGMPTDAAIKRVLRGLAGTSVASARLVNPPKDSDTGAAWISVDLDSEDLGPRSVWLGALVEGAVSDLLRTTQATTRDVIDGALVHARRPAGTATELVLGAGSVQGGQQFHSPDDEAIREHVTEVGRRFGITVKSLTILHPLETAIAVTFEVPTGPDIDWTTRDLNDALVQSPTNLEGALIHLVSPSGKDLLTTSAAYRTGTSNLSFAPRQDERFGALHGSLFSALSERSWESARSQA